MLNFCSKQFLIGMFKGFTFTPQDRTSNSYGGRKNRAHNLNMMTSDRQATVIANNHVAISKSFFVWEAMGDSSAVHDEAEGFRGTRGQRKVTAEKTNIIHPL